MNNVSLSQEQIEYLHSIGKMPDWVYYQINGKSAVENYNQQKKDLVVELPQNVKSEIEDCIVDAVDRIIAKLS